MPSVRTAFVSAVVALAAIVSADDYTIDPNSVDIKTRERWCQDQMNICPFLCQQVEPRTTLVNTCDPESLTYGCLCGDNKQPNMSEYSLTLPYYVCTTWVQQCQAGCGDRNDACISSCAQDHPCGATNPTRSNATSTATTTTATAPTGSATEGQIFDGPVGGGSNNNNNDSAAAALEAGRRFGLGIVVAGLAVAFGMLA